MQNVLDVYQRPDAPTHPVVCLDETSRQLLSDVRPPLPLAPGCPARHDPENVRGGVVNLFLVTEPLRGWRHVTVSAQRTRIDFAHCVKELIDVHYPDPARIVLVMDQLNTHCMRPSRRPMPSGWGTNWRSTHTPKYGSWQHSRDRNRYPATAMPEPAPRRLINAGARHERLDRSAQRRQLRGRLALHDRRRSDHAQASLPSN